MRSIRITICLGVFLLMTSCYSIRFQVANGQWEPADTERNDAFAGYNVRTLDTVVTRKLTTGNHYFNIFDCESGALHTVEYRTSFGGILLNAITLGRKKKVKINYVCIKENSM